MIYPGPRYFDTTREPPLHVTKNRRGWLDPKGEVLSPNRIRDQYDTSYMHKTTRNSVSYRSASTIASWKFRKSEADGKTSRAIHLVQSHSRRYRLDYSQKVSSSRQLKQNWTRQPSLSKTAGGAKKFVKLEGEETQRNFYSKNLPPHKKSRIIVQN